MNKLLISTAVAAVLGASGAFAQAIQEPIYQWTETKPAVYGDNPATSGTTETDFLLSAEVVNTFYGTAEDYNNATPAAGFALALVGPVGADNALEGNQTSLLDSLLAKADLIQVTLGNTSENLANIDGSISIDLTRFDTPYASDVNVGDTIAIMEPLNATIGELTTTVIGSLGDGTVNTTAILANIETMDQAVTSSSKALATTFSQDNGGLQQVYNLSSNLGSLDASVDVIMAGVNVDNLAGVATTAIGSLGTGAITSNVTNNANGLTQRLIGTN